MIYTNKNNKIFCFDLDGVICNNTYGDYKKAKPKTSAINKINSLFDSNNYIIVFTARYMGFAKGNRNKAIELGYDFTKKQLNNWGLKYHELIFGKPEYDVIIDDKSYNYNNEWISKF
tara:strand:+ start:2268 stop:2618 length:351 start_codon:yes stop_codon:yes gene_type:complete